MAGIQHFLNLCTKLGFDSTPDYMTLKAVLGNLFKAVEVSAVNDKLLQSCTDKYLDNAVRTGLMRINSEAIEILQREIDE